MEADFSGWATKAGLVCSDGRTITPQAFQHMNGVQVPLVWKHGHDSIDNVLGHVLLETREEGVYCYGFFNDLTQGVNAKKLVQHKDLDSLSIWANNLVEKMIGKSKQVLHGMIREVSLVLAGANPGAKIDYIAIQHGEGGDLEELADEAIIHTGLPIEFEQQASDEDLEHETIQEVYDSFTELQKTVVHYMIGAALEQGQAGEATHSGTDSEKEKVEEAPKEPESPVEEPTVEEDLTHQEGSTMTRNVFELKGGTQGGVATATTLSHDDMKGIFADAVKRGSLREAVENYAVAHGIDDIDVLFPNARTLTDTPEFIKRRTEWVANVLNGVRNSPFSRIKTILADITQDEARAKGYIKGTLKKEEFFGVTKRTTGPTTVYKKQKLDRDDILDITDFDVVAWIKGEMRLMLEEEIARAILIGDGRDAGDDDKVKDPAGATDGTGIRSIVNDHEMYVTTLRVNLADASSSYAELIDEILLGRRFYRGTGQPTLYTTNTVATRMLLVKDTTGRRLYTNKAELVSALNVADIVEVEAMEEMVNAGTLLGILVNLTDYNVGTDRGGEVNFFDFFDIDYNQYKYLDETRVSGALVRYKSAIKIVPVASTDVLAVPTKPTFDPETGALTIPTVTGVTYKHGVTTVTNGGSPYTVAVGTPWTIDATANSGYYFESDAEDSWTFTAEA
jgi:capsid protein/prohead serine protease